MIWQNFLYVVQHASDLAACASDLVELFVCGQCCASYLVESLVCMKKMMKRSLRNTARCASAAY